MNLVNIFNRLNYFLKLQKLEYNLRISKSTLEDTIQQLQYVESSIYRIEKLIIVKSTIYDSSNKDFSNSEWINFSRWLRRTIEDLQINYRNIDYLIKKYWWF